MDYTQHPDAKAVLDALSSDDSEAIRSAAFEAGNQRTEEAVELLCRHIANTNIGIQEAAEYALRKIRGPKTVAALLPLLRNDDAPTRNVAMDVLREIAEDDIPALQEHLHDADPDMRIFIADILGYTKSKKASELLCDALLKDPEVNVRYQAAISLGTLAFPESVSALSQAMHDEEWVQFAVVETLTKIHADTTINALAQSLATSSELVCSIIIDALAELGNIKAVPQLFKSLDRVSEALRHKTVKAIVKILGKDSISMLSPADQDRFHGYLLEALGSSEEDIQTAALQGIGAMRRENATEVLFEYALGLSPENESMLEAVLNAIAAVGPNETFSAMLTSGDEQRAMLALHAATLMEERRAVDLLKDIFWNIPIEMQRTACARIAEAGLKSDAYFFLDLLEKSADSELLKYAIYFLGMRFTITEAEERIFGILFKEDQELQEAALQACINMRSAELNQHFVEMFQSRDETQRMMAVYALGAYSAEENLQFLTIALEDESAKVRQLAVEAFAQQPDLTQYIQMLLPRMSDESPDVRISTIELFGNNGNEELLPQLLPALQDPNEWVCIRAVEAIGQMKAVSAVPQLAQIATSASPMLLFKIITTLGQIGGNEAYDLLISLTQHPDEEVARAAAEMLETPQQTESIESAQE